MRTGGRGAGSGKEPPSKGGSSNQTNHRGFNSMDDAFRAHLWGLRVAEHVARGCVGGGWTRSYDRDTA